MTIDLSGLPPIEQQLYTHTLASAIACAASNTLVEFRVSGREPSPAAQRVRVLAELDTSLAGLDKLIRAKKAAPAGVPVATLGRRLASNGERIAADGYTPGPGLKTFVCSLAADAMHQLAKAGWS
jgi:hypothetical protein